MYLSIQQPGLSGDDIETVDADADGDHFSNDDATFVRFIASAPVTVTVHAVAPCNQGITHDEVIAVEGDVILGPFPARRFSGTVRMTYSNAASVQVGVFR